MARENKYTAVILKSQAYGEADEIITFFTKEAGKIRGLAKSSKAATSKLSYSLQPLFLSKITLAGNHSLPKVIEAVTLNTFRNLRENSSLLNVWYVVAELLIKATADAQKNADLFDLCEQYLVYLDTDKISETGLHASLVKFKIHFLENLGLAIHSPKNVEPSKQLLFSDTRGGFYYGDISADSLAITAETFEVYKKLAKINFADIREVKLGISELEKLVNSFLTYQLERELKSEKFFKQG